MADFSTLMTEVAGNFNSAMRAADNERRWRPPALLQLFDNPFARWTPSYDLTKWFKLPLYRAGTGLTRNDGTLTPVALQVGVLEHLADPDRQPDHGLPWDYASPEQLRNDLDPARWDAHPISGRPTPMRVLRQLWPWGSTDDTWFRYGKDWRDHVPAHLRHNLAEGHG